MLNKDIAVSFMKLKNYLDDTEMLMENKLCIHRLSEELLMIIIIMILDIYTTSFIHMAQRRIT